MARRLLLEIIADPAKALAGLRKTDAGLVRLNETVAAVGPNATKSMATANAAVNTLNASLTKSGFTAEQSIKKQAEASLRRDAFLRQEILQARTLAATFAKESAERVTYENIAIQKERQLAGAMSVTSAEAKIHAANIAASDASLSRAFRGAAAGSGLFKSLGRSLAFASGGFIAFAGVSTLLRRSVDEAEHAAATERQLATQFAAGGLDFRRYRDELDKTIISTSRISGFTRDQLSQSFLQAFRGARDFSAGLKLMQASADAARGTGKGLNVVTLALTKAFLGQTGAARRLGILIPPNVKGMAALEFVIRRFRGQAEAGTTEQQRFAAAMQLTEISIGRGLLPAITDVLQKSSAWLLQQKNQEKIQKDTSAVINTTVHAVEDLADAVKLADSVLGPFVNAVGGLDNVMRLALEAFVATKILKWAAAIRESRIAVALLGDAVVATEAKIAAANLGGAAAAGAGSRGGGGTPPTVPTPVILPAGVKAEEEAVAAAETRAATKVTGLRALLAEQGVLGVLTFGKLGRSADAAGTKIEGTTSRVAGLTSALKTLGAIGAITVTIDVLRRNAQEHGGGVGGIGRGILAEIKGEAGIGPIGVAEAGLRDLGISPAHARLATRVETDVITLGMAEAVRALPGIFRSAPKPRLPIGGFATRDLSIPFLAPPVTSPSGTLVGVGPGAPSTRLGFKARFADQELKLAQAQLTTEQADDRRVLEAEARLIRERIKRLGNARSTLAERTQLTQQLGQIEGQITAIDKQANEQTIRFKRLELALAQAQLTATQSDDRAILQVEAAAIRSRLATIPKTKKTLDARIELTQQLAGIEGQIASIDQQAKQDQLDALDKQRSAASDHLSKIRDRESQLRSKIKEITDAFNQTVDNIRGQIGQLFTGPVLLPTERQIKAALGVRFEDLDPKALTRDLNAQVQQFAAFEHGLARLAKRGAPKELLKELQAQGLAAAPEVAALAAASPADLRAFFKAFQQRERLAIQSAKTEMHAQLVTLHADRVALRGLRQQEVKVSIEIKGIDRKAVKVRTRRTGTAGGRR